MSPVILEAIYTNAMGFFNRSLSDFVLLSMPLHDADCSSFVVAIQKLTKYQTICIFYVFIIIILSFFRAVWLNFPGFVLIQTLACSVGLVMFAYFHTCDPAKLGIVKKTDQVCHCSQFTYKKSFVTMTNTIYTNTI